MRVGIIGCGSIGTRHAKNVAELRQYELSFFDTDLSKAFELKRNFDFSHTTILLSGDYLVTQVCRTIDELIDTCDALVVCTPHSTHAEYASMAAMKGKHVLVEKPVAMSLDDAKKLGDILKTSNGVFGVAYNLRHHPVVKQAHRQVSQLGRLLSARFEYGSFLPNWRPNADYRSNYAASTNDGGIIMDDIHELDLVAHLLGGEFTKLSCVAGNFGGLGIACEDSADISMVVLWEGVHPVPVSVHMDYLQRSAVRKFRIVGEKGTLIGDLNSPSLRIETQSYTTDFKFDNYKTNDMYMNEISEFLNEASGRVDPSKWCEVASFEQSLPSLKMALAAKESAKSNMTVLGS